MGKRTHHPPLIQQQQRWRRASRITLPPLLAAAVLLLALTALRQPAAAQSDPIQPVWRQFGPEQATFGELLTYRYWLDSTPSSAAQGDAEEALTVVATIDLSANVQATRLRSGWFVNQNGADQPVDIDIRYQTGRGRWETWASWRDVSRTTPRFLLTSELDLPDGERVQQIELQIRAAGGVIRPAPDPDGLPALDGVVIRGGQTLQPGDELRSCATLTLPAETAFRPLTSCTRTLFTTGQPDVQLAFETVSVPPFALDEEPLLYFSTTENGIDWDAARENDDGRTLVVQLPPGVAFEAERWEAQANLPLPEPEVTVLTATENSNGQLVEWRWPTLFPTAAISETAADDLPEALTFDLTFRIALSSSLTAGSATLRGFYRPPAGTFTCFKLPAGQEPFDVNQNGRSGGPICTLPLTLPLSRSVTSPLPDPLPLVIPPGARDYSDAPDPFLPAWHTIQPGVSLGLLVDEEPAPLTSFAADGDDRDGLPDEEGLYFGAEGVGITGQVDNSVVAVILNRGDDILRLSGWVDFNRDGVLSDDEQIIFGHKFAPSVNPQAERFEFPIPAAAECGPTLARFRLSDGVVPPDGPATSGEVEDVAYTINCIADIVVSVLPNVDPIGRDEMIHWVISATNRGPSPALDIVLTQTIPAEVGYYDHSYPSASGWRCSDEEAITDSGLLICRVPQLAAGETLTVDLALVVPRRYEGSTLSQTAEISTATVENNRQNNRASATVTVDKQWLLYEIRPSNNYVFVHAAFDPNLTNNPDLRERDYRLNEPIPNLIQVPISLAVGYNTGTTPWLTVPSCIANPADPTCNDNNRIYGQTVLQSYTIQSVHYEDDSVPSYEVDPEAADPVFINRISDANMSRCAGRGSCVGYDLFQVERGGITPYAWQAPFDYIYLNFVTKGGREVSCPESGEYEGRCIIINDAKPGFYAVEGEVQLLLEFEDVRLPEGSLTLRARPIPFTAYVQILAPFVEPEQ